ncbi:adenylate/guanylate cyclase domain-containing protein [Bradyrhizobium sp. LMTR 3]|uniref:adenylate/guanylate cyclase domain-containing protein n=1 Tax=Bradyrhizobium sp. LMTR 3 TaxID=189873 RepID=UPI000ADBA5BC|nr:adenylate/guanylate cyclase domain-containing protein [Bradyrhizobium sp. LMTR 3]
MDELERWLAPLGLMQLAPALRANDVDLKILPELSEADLEKLGLSLGQRKKLLKAAACLPQPSELAGPSAASAPSLSAVSSAERRQLTVMFCDLVGSTALSAGLDPEDLREVIGAYHRCVAETVARFDGFVAKYMGDGVLLYFGYPHAHEDDAERAVRAGLALIDAVDQLQTSERLRVRIGIGTGLVVVGDLIGSGEAQERVVVGETPNLAARLQALGEPNTIVVGPTTRHLLGDLFEYRDLGTVAMKGFPQPVRAYQVLRSSAVESRFEAFHSAGLTPLVGREEEIELLLRRWQRAISGEGQVVLLSAEPGVGKSRLVAALQEKLQAEPYSRPRCFCSPHHQGSALYPVIKQLERAARFARDDPLAVKLDKLEALLAGAATTTEDVPLLAELLSLPSDRYSLAALSPQAKKERTLQALIRHVENLSQRNPVLMVFEDVHWIDPTSLELLQMTVDRVQQLPVLLLLTFRPEFPPPWIGQPHVTMLTLGRLNRRDTATLVERVVGEKVLPRAIVHEIVDRTDGVPLFVEELTKAVLETGAVEGDAKAVLSRISPGALAVPATLHASLLARLDRLGPEAKEIAQTGAAIGREFSDDLIRAVSPLPEAPLQAALEQLTASQLIFHRGSSAYSFKHALVQDTAYGTLLRSRRQPLHARIARALEEHFPDIAATQPEVLAHHFTEANLTESAVAYWRKAGQRAAERSAHAEAIAHLRNGLIVAEQVADPAERACRELELQLVLAPVLIATKSWSAPEVEQAYLRARDLCRQAGDVVQLFTVSWGLWLVYQQRCEFKTARDLLDELFAVARRSADPGLLLQAHHAAWTTLLNLPEPTACRAHLEAGLTLYRPDAYRAHKFLYGSHDAGVCNRYTAAAALWPLGFPQQALAMAREAVSMARELSHPFSLVLALVFAGMIYQHRREAEPALEQAEAAIAVCAEHGIAPHLAAAGSILRGWAIAERGQAVEGIAEVRGGLAAVEPTGVRIRRPYYLALLAEALAWVGEIEQGLTALAEATTAVEETGEQRWEAEIYRLIGELTMARPGGDRTEAEAYFRRAVDVAGRQSAKALELRATMSLARLWRDQGKQRQAGDLLAPVYGWFTEGFDTPDLREAKALLDALQ